MNYPRAQNEFFSFAIGELPILIASVEGDGADQRHLYGGRHLG